MLGQDQSQSQAGKQCPDIGTQTSRVILWQASGFAQVTVSWFRILRRYRDTQREKDVQRLDMTQKLALLLVLAFDE